MRRAPPGCSKPHLFRLRQGCAIIAFGSVRSVSRTLRMRGSGGVRRLRQPPGMLGWCDSQLAMTRHCLAQRRVLLAALVRGLRDVRPPVDDPTPRASRRQATHPRGRCCFDGSPGFGEGGGMKHNRRSRPPVQAPSAFAGFRFPPEVILLREPKPRRSVNATEPAKLNARSNSHACQRGVTSRC
jgi:hypothetical protein